MERPGQDYLSDMLGSFGESADSPLSCLCSLRALVCQASPPYSPFSLGNKCLVPRYFETIITLNPFSSAFLLPMGVQKERDLGPEGRPA